MRLEGSVKEHARQKCDDQHELDDKVEDETILPAIQALLIVCSAIAEANEKCNKGENGEDGVKEQAGAIVKAETAAARADTTAHDVGHARG